MIFLRNRAKNNAVRNSDLSVQVSGYFAGFRPIGRNSHESPPIRRRTCRAADARTSEISQALLGILHNIPPISEIRHSALTRVGIGDLAEFRPIGLGFR